MGLMPDRVSHTRGHRPPGRRVRAAVPVVRSRGGSRRRSPDVDCSRGDVDSRGDAYSSRAGANQGQTERSTSATAPKSTMAMSDSRIIELNASSVFQYDVADSPVAVSTTTGKKATRNATNTLGISPWPSTSSSTGAIAILGTDWASTISGYSALLITGE